jgi:hypothetical protein
MREKKDDVQQKTEVAQDLELLSDSCPVLPARDLSELGVECF